MCRPYGPLTCHSVCHQETMDLFAIQALMSRIHVAQGDIAAGKMIFGVEGVDPERRQKLIDLLEINLEWRLNKVSDGQRRRVQICMGLLKPYQVTYAIPSACSCFVQLCPHTCYPLALTTR